MIQCNNCGFAVNDSMKFSLMQNTCPSCGAALFSSRDSNLITMLQGKISSERFSSSLTEELVYDVSLFIFNELKHGIGKSLIDEALVNQSSSDGNEKEVQNSEESQFVDDIRNEVEKEYEEQISQLSDDGDVIIEDKEIFEKAERLKRLHEQRFKNNPNIGKMVPNKKNRKSSAKVKRVG